MNYPNATHDHFYTTLGDIGNKIVAVGGSLSNKVELFDINSNTWTMQPSFPYCSKWVSVWYSFHGIRWGQFVFRIGEYAVISRQSSVLIIGGYCDDTYSSLITKFTIMNDNNQFYEWKRVGNLQNGRIGLRAIANGNRFYVVGGTADPKIT